MFEHKSIVDILTNALYEKKVKLFKYNSGKHIVYYLQTPKFSGPNKLHPKPMGEAVGQIIRFEGSEVPYEGDYMNLVVLVGNEPYNLSINSVEDILIIN